MSKEDQAYVCTLTEASLKKAQAELFENPQDRLHAVQTLREWIQDQPHINFPTDTPTLLQFLRGAKFSQLRAREIIQNQLQLRRDTPSWFCDVDTRSKDVLSLVESGYMIPLPKRDPEGRLVIIFRLGALEPKNPHHSLANEMKSGMAMSAYNSRDENVQVNGQVFIFDFTGYTVKHFKRVTSENMSKSHKAWQDATPGRVKKFHFYNAGTFFEGLMAIMRPFTKKKYLERMQTHSTLETVYKHIPMEVLPEEYLPDDYEGPSAGPISNIIENIKNELTAPELHERLLDFSSSKYFIDETKRPKDVPTAHFRKLNVD